MHKTLRLALLVLMFTFSLTKASYAFLSAPDSLHWREDYGPYKEGQPGEEARPPINSYNMSDDYDWLYEELMGDSNKSGLPKESRRSFEVHLLDTYNYFPHLADIKASNLDIQSSIKGQITYVGFIRKYYRHDVRVENGEVVIEVRVHFQNATQTDLQNFNNLMLAAEEIWNSSRPSFDFKYRFRFRVAENASQAHFSVYLYDSTRGPYDSKWSREWNNYAVAHELGHMMGLGDEYETISGEMKCLRESLMCSSWYGNLMQHHYYFILRRLLKRTSQQFFQ